MDNRIYTPPIEQNFNYLNFWGRSRGVNTVERTPGVNTGTFGGVNVENCERELAPKYLATAASGSVYNNYGGGTHHNFTFNALG